MPVVSLPFTYVIRKPSGKEYWRFRRGDLHTALPGKPGDAEFHARYAELCSMAEREDPARPAAGTMSALIAAYRVSAEFKMGLRESTQLDYGKTLALIDAEMGDEMTRLITFKMVKAVRDSYASTPRKAHKVKQMVSRLYTWGDECGLTRKGQNPAAEFKKLKYRSEIIMPWSEEEIRLFLAHAPRHLITPVMLALYTGQRAADVVAMDWTAYQGAFIRVRQSKTGTPLDIACHPTLKKHLDSVRTAFKGKICRAASGRPYSPNGFAKAVGDQCAKINGMPARSPHGLKYAAAGRLEEAGVTPGIAMKILGNLTYALAVQYMSGRIDSAAAVNRMRA